MQASPLFSFAANMHFPRRNAIHIDFNILAKLFKRKNFKATFSSVILHVFQKIDINKTLELISLYHLGCVVRVSNTSSEPFLRFSKNR